MLTYSERQIKSAQKMLKDNVLSLYLLFQYKSHTKVKYKRTIVRCGIQFNATFNAFNFSHFIESFVCKKTCELSNAVRKKKKEKKRSALRARM